MDLDLMRLADNIDRYQIAIDRFATVTLSRWHLHDRDIELLNLDNFVDRRSSRQHKSIRAAGESIQIDSIGSD